MGTDTSAERKVSLWRRENGDATPLLGVLYAHLLALATLIASTPACLMWYQGLTTPESRRDLFAGLLAAMVLQFTEPYAVVFWIASISVFIGNRCWKANELLLTSFLLVGQLSIACTGVGLYTLLSLLW